MTFHGYLCEVSNPKNLSHYQKKLEILGMYSLIHIRHFQYTELIKQWEFRRVFYLGFHLQDA